MRRVGSAAVVLALFASCLLPLSRVDGFPLVAQSPEAPGIVTPPPTATERAPSSPPTGRIALSFDNADLETVVQAVSEIVGFNLTVPADLDRLFRRIVIAPSVRS
jgi:hypothetical protein